MVHFRTYVIQSLGSEPIFQKNFGSGPYPDIKDIAKLNCEKLSSLSPIYSHSTDFSDQY